MTADRAGPTSASKTAILLSECQNGLLGRESILQMIARAAGPMLPAIARLVAAGRAADATVVHLTFAPTRSGATANRKSPLFARLLPATETWTAGHEAAQPLPELAVTDDDLVFQRPAGLSPTRSTPTFPVLRNLGIDTVILAGISLNIAIPLIAAEAVDEGFAVIVARDAVVGTPPEHAASVLEHSLSFIAELRTVDEIVRAWEGTGSRR